MKIPLVDLKAQYDALKGEIDKAMAGVIESTQFILGPELQKFEAEIASFCQTKHAVGVASGTDALQLSLLACGIQPGDEVITTPFTFIATAETIAKCGAVPVFVDIDPRTYNIDAAKISARITKKTRAILPVHLYGQPADMDPILDMAARHGLKVIEDCAQALGAKYKDRKVGSIGDAGCLSFFPSKVLGAYGDGGMVVTNNPEVAEKVARLRDHGSTRKYFYDSAGFNSRLDALQAAILRVKLKHLNEWLEKRRSKAAVFSRLFERVAGVTPPYKAPYGYHIFNYYTVRLDSARFNRDRLAEHLRGQGVATAIYYPLSLHLQGAYRSLGYKKGDLPESERAQEAVLSLPMYPELRDDEIEKIVRLIEEADKRR